MNINDVNQRALDLLNKELKFQGIEKYITEKDLREILQKQGCSLRDVFCTIKTGKLSDIIC